MAGVKPRIVDEAAGEGLRLRRKEGVMERRTHARRGFTLVEVLIVLVIIGLLAGILTVAVRNAFNKAEQARILLEISQMDQALEQYRSDYGGYPPTFGVDWSYEQPLPGPDAQKDAGRKERFMRHVRRAFPRFAGSYDDIHAYIEMATDGGGNILFQSPTDPAEGMHLDHLDAAEALVFWLGGLPDPQSGSKLMGFSADAANPFYHNDPNVGQPQRSSILFEFDPERLVDRDEDGWWEYIPESNTPFETPPYVYFDAASYGLRPTYPHDAFELSTMIPGGEPPPPGQSNLVPPTGSGGLTDNWGVAVPYARMASNVQTVSPSIEWLAPNKFQIICGGADGSYGRDANLAEGVMVFYDVRTINVVGGSVPVPSIESAHSNTPETGFSAGDYDNLTNMVQGPLQDEVDESAPE